MAILDKGTLVENFTIDRVLGQGGFGVTYLAAETALDRHVAIKEYFPQMWASREGTTVSANPASEGDYEWGLESFLKEAKTLARFKHPSVVQVIRIIEANGTAYMVLGYEAGDDFGKWLKKLKRLPTQEELDNIVEPLLDALAVIHSNKILHRDIAPDNVKIREDGTPVLLDFGSAREAIGKRTKTISAIVKSGYSPVEQYAAAGKNQGPWTDIYALGATLYRAVTGKTPPEATERAAKDEYVPAAEAAKGKYRTAFLAAIDHALERQHEDRPQTVSEWRAELFGKENVANRKTAVAGPGRHGRGGEPPRGGGGEPARGSAWIWAAAAVILLAVAAGGYYWGVMLPAEQEQFRLEAAREDDAVWAAAQRGNTVETYRAYLDAHPDGRHKERAEAEIAALEKAAEEARKAAEKKRADDAAWAKAQSGNSLSSYHAYLNAHPDGAHTDEALREIAALERAAREAQTATERRHDDERAWARAQREHTLAAYRAYLLEHPNGRFKAQAGERIAALDKSANDAARKADERAWFVAQEENTAAAYRSYLAAHPEGRFREEAGQLIAALDKTARNERTEQERRADEGAWFAALDTNTAAAYRSYLAAHPDGRYREEARQMITALDKTAAQASRPGGSGRSTARAGCREIVAGAAMSLTGKYSTNGIHTKNGYDFAAKKINDSGLLDLGGACYFMSIRYYDDESSPAHGAQLADRLIRQDGVKVMLGPYSSGLTRAVAAVTEKYRVPMVEAEGASNSLFDNGYRYLFGILSTGNQYLASAVDLAAEVATKYGKEPSAVKLALAFENDPFSLDVRAGVIETAQKHGMSIVIDDKFPRDLSSMKATLDKVWPLKPDLLVVSAHSKGADTAVREIGEGHIRVPMIAVTHCESARVTGKYPAAANGILCPTQWAETLTYKDDIFGSASDYARDITARIPAYATGGIPYQTAQASAAVYVLADAIRRAGADDSERVRDALAATDLQTFYGRIRFSPAGNNVAKPMVLRQIQNGSYNVVAPTDYASHKLVWPRPGR